MRTSEMIVDFSAFKENIEQIKKYVGENVRLMPVVKARGYGTYLHSKTEYLNNFEIVAVAFAEEGEELRKLGYKNEIFILNQPDILDLECIIKNDLSIGLSSIEFLNNLPKGNTNADYNDDALKSKVIKAHLEIETGMGRTGIALENLDEFIAKVKEYRNIKVEGVYTHFSVADEDREYTNSQIEKFKIGKEKVEEAFGTLKYVHSSASNGILNFEDARFNTVRPGLIMYGYEPFENAHEKLNVKPVAKLKSKINFIKTVNAGDSISYGRRFIADKTLRVATVPIGYADGIRRILTEYGEVVVNEKRAKILGTICMDSFMIDVTDIPNVTVGTEVYIWDNEIVTLEEIAKKCGTINYEILSSISERVPREFI